MKHISTAHMYVFFSHAKCLEMQSQLIL